MFSLQKLHSHREKPVICSDAVMCCHALALQPEPHRTQSPCQCGDIHTYKQLDLKGILNTHRNELKKSIGI